MKVIVLQKFLRSKPRTLPISGIVFHSTDGASATSSIAWLRLTGNSYNYIIERDGTIYKCVPLDRTANHAGSSYAWHEEAKGISRAQSTLTWKFKAGTCINGYTVGIAFANLQSKGERITQAQLDAAEWLTGQILGQHPLLSDLTTHYAVSPRRKTDPSMMSVTWLARLAKKYGLKVWGLKVA